ncbi:helix-turn-helix domain-containing protein [Halobacteriovorax sp. ZH1_bin.1]|uniref:helix-turn-helix domain-containing protein n=1 Tax=Halobacteriovorax sp. ZH1_bin.1 TaxID=3157723 RepID=UPI0037159DB5
MNHRKIFGKYIKELREARDLTQEELAKFAGVTFATVNRIEQGSANPTLDTIAKILKVFGLEITGTKSGIVHD